MIGANEVSRSVVPRHAGLASLRIEVCAGGVSGSLSARSNRPLPPRDPTPRPPQTAVLPARRNLLQRPHLI